MAQIERQSEDMEEPEAEEEPEVSLRKFFKEAPLVVDQWMQRLQEGLPLAPSLRAFWKESVPLAFQLETRENDSLEWRFCEYEPVLFQLLERFICGGGDLKSMLERLSTPPLCGRMFKFGEPTYACRECGVDSTCVFCAACFKHSVHQHHKYKMSKSPGGGRCDCGDVEAWKTDPYCDIHSEALRKQDDKKQFPEDIALRARMVFDVVLAYAFELLTHKHSVSLPSDLKQVDDSPLRMDVTDSFCLVLYNDEVHTFEQVFDAMHKVMKNDHRDMNDLVTRVDREGRAVIKCSNFQHCSELRLELEKCTSRQNNQPIKVHVLHVDVVAHQMFAMKLLDWLQRIVQTSEGFRTVFARVVLDNNSSSSVVERVLMEDANMWKSARTAWHHLFMSGLLVEYESKKALARVFTKKYGNITKEYIRDDHDRHVSIASLSVQLFTAPTVAHFLIAEERALFILWNTFVSECAPKVKDRKLVFERNVSNLHFRRAMEVLADIKYLLSVQPKEWTDDLRRGFLMGLVTMVDLMAYMQDMDPVKRQEGQHVEYEPEWETGFLLHMKMASIATQVVEWCGSDRVVLIKAYRNLLTKLKEVCGDTRPQMEVHELADHSANCYVYDVASEPVSIHLPLSRLLAGLHLHLERHGLCFDSPELQLQLSSRASTAPSPSPSPQQLMEPVLRLQVMIAQVHAGMWRRNGYSLITQIGLYHGVKCRTEMLDRDIAMLQVGAALIESNQFLILMLHKFNLLHWANPNFERNPDEDGMRRTINLVEEFLGLLVTIIGERYTPGVGRVTPEDQMKKEVIQQLCIRPLSHSELYTTFPYEEMQENGIEAVLNEVADFKRPTNRKGVYELKEHLYSEYNVFFYHYTREERSRSEEQQRKRNKAREDLDCCPPPPLPQLTPAFAMLADLLQCDVMLHVLSTVLSRAADLRAQSFSEVQLHKALHLMGYALLEQERDPEGFIQFTERAERWRLERLLEDLLGSARVETLKGMIKWVLNKYRSVKKSRQPRASQAEPSAPQSQAEFLASRDKEWRTKMAAEKRAKIMAQMMTMQKNFMKENANMFQAGDEREEAEGQDADMEGAEFSEVSPVAVGPQQTLPSGQSEHHVCILCQEEEHVSLSGPTLVLAAYVQKSAVLTRKNERSPDFRPMFLSADLGPAPHASTCGHVMHATCWRQYYDNVLTKENRRPYRLRQPASFDIEHKEFLCPLCACLSNAVLPLVPQLPLICRGARMEKLVPFKSWICVDLQKCPISQPDDEKGRGARQLINQLNKKGSESCPGPTLSATPALSVEGGTEGSPVSQDQPTRQQKVTASASKEAVQSAAEREKSSAEQSHSSASDSDSDEPIAARTVKGPARKSSDKSKTDKPPAMEFSSDLAYMIVEFAKTTFEKCSRPVQDEADEMQVPVTAWQCCSYTIHSLEVLLRDEGKPLLGHMSSRQHDCLQGLVRMMALLTSAWNKPHLVMHHVYSLYTQLVNNHPRESCVLDWDGFGMLVPVVFLLAKQSVPFGAGYELHGLRLALFAEVIKCLLSLDPNKEEDCAMEAGHTSQSMEVDDVEACGEPSMTLEDVSVISDLLELLCEELSFSFTVMPSARQLWDKVKEYCRPFLRCAVLFFHFLTTVPPLPVLTSHGGDTFNNMCSYLGLTGSWRELLFDDTMQALAKHWSNHPRILQILKDRDPQLFVSPLRINRLVSLPEDYSELMNSVSEFYCRKWVESRNPTMCLVCGEMLCSQNYCCQRELNTIQVGACTYHAAVCGAGCGIFLRVRECEVLLLALPNRGTFMTSPYVDDYGETDQGLRRGNRLRLCPDLYRSLELLWLSHGIREYVSRSIDRGSTQIIGQWHQF